MVTRRYVLDATETGDLLPLTGTEYVTGFESQRETGEPRRRTRPQPLNMQAVSVCFAVDHVDGDHTIDKPAGYDFWRDYQPDFWGAPLLSWRSPNPRTLGRRARIFTPNPDDDPLAVQADQRGKPRRRQPVDLPADRRPEELHRRRVRQRHQPGELAA